MHLMTGKTIKGISTSTVTVGDFNTPVTIMDRIAKKKIRDLNNAVSQLYLIDIYT